MLKQTIAASASPPDFGGRELRIYLAHAMASIGANLLITSFFFYAKQIFHWSGSQCLMLVAAEGVVYVIGALAADRVSVVLGRRGALVLIQIVLAVMSAVAWIDPSPRIVVAALLAYTLVSAAGWPVFESLIAIGAGARLLSRRIGVYNLVWSGVGTLTLAISGEIIAHAPWGMFALPLASHVFALGLVVRGHIEPFGAAAADHALPEPALLRQRRLALWLSRIGLPATYTVLYSLVALMPSLRVIQSFSPAAQTVVASLWMATRFLAFIVLGISAWWHTRPRILLAAAIIMAVSFLGVTLRPADWLGHGSVAVTSADQILMIAWQIPLGITMGLIYSASLYFGMVLSEGSTEHGGYHEALIGVGQIIGPVAALAGEMVKPGDIWTAVAAVGGVLCVSLIAAAVVTVRSGGESESAGSAVPAK